MNYYYNQQYGQEQAERENAFRRQLVKVYGIMAAGLTLTFVTAFLTSWFLPQLITNFPLAAILLVAQVITVIAFSTMIRRARFGAMVTMFVIYSVLTGLSISYIFALYEMRTIFLCFAAAALAFGILALLGHNTKRELSSYGRFFLVGLIGLLFLSVIGFFIGSSILEIIICCVGLILFLGITAYDTQRIHRYYESETEGGEMAQKMTVYFAMQLYLDFINIFLYLLRLFGRSSRN